jgi:hypothetical protein
MDVETDARSMVTCAASVFDPFDNALATSRLTREVTPDIDWLEFPSMSFKATVIGTYMVRVVIESPEQKTLSRPVTVGLRQLHG